MKFGQILEITCMIAVIIVLIMFIYTARSDGAKCMVSPLKYSVDMMTKANDNQMSCFCQFEDIRINPLIANSSGVYSTNGIETRGTIFNLK